MLAVVENRLIEVLPRADHGPARVADTHNDSRPDEGAALGWLVILAALTIGALVLALGQVSHQAVQQGEIRRAATAANAAAFWSCHSSRSRELRDSCLAQLNPATQAAQGADATSQGQHIIAVDLGAPISGH